MHRVPLLGLAALIACTSAPDAGPGADSNYLYLWTAGADSTQPDYLAVLDVTPSGDRYGSLVTTVPVPGRGNVPHHSEHELAPDNLLLANGFATGQSFTFDLNTPAEPRIIGQFGDLAGYSHPHTFARLPDGNVLATFQMGHDSAGMTPGGLVEMTPRGEVLRSSSSFGAGVPRGVRTYSVLPVPALDRAISTTTDMDDSNPHTASEIQVWRLSDLALLHTFKLAQGPLG
ncbi:MAG: selenium-binding protein SBP56-related protein, partial [Gemmatimonadota bacterium]|nr:selenium-binding protein SBP56-related protein [Gemmatimonadota bacterium]